MENDYSAYCGGELFQGLISKKLLASEVIGDKFAFTLSQLGASAIEQYEREEERAAREQETLQLERESVRVSQQSLQTAHESLKASQRANWVSIASAVVAFASLLIAALGKWM